MRILVSNDDGVQAPGIHALVQELIKNDEVKEVVVVAPDRQRSASSHGITLHHRLYASEVDFQHDKVKAYALSGTPVDCTKWGIFTHGMDRTFDFMLSGINEGANLATDVLYSGTVAAAGEAALQGIPAIAFSLIGEPYHYEAAARVALRIFTDVNRRRSLPSDTFLSVNFPPLDNLDHAPISISRLGLRSYRSVFHEELDAQGRAFYRHDGDALEETGGSDTDVRIVERGEISITPLRYRFTNETFLDTLKSWF